MITEVVETENELVKNRKKYEPVQGQEAEVVRRPKKESTDIITITTTSKTIFYSNFRILTLFYICTVRIFTRKAVTF